MFANTKAFSGFAVDDVQKAREFYGETLGVNTEVIDDENGLMVLHLAGGRDTFVYRKPDFEPCATRSSTSRWTTSTRRWTTSPHAASSSSGTTVSSKTGRASRAAWWTSPGSKILPATSCPCSARCRSEPAQRLSFFLCRPSQAADSLVLAFAVGSAVVLASILGNSTGYESRSESAAAVAASAGRSQITCDQLEAIARAPLVLQPETDAAVLDRSYALDRTALDRIVVRIDGPPPEIVRIERSGPSTWTRILSGLNAVGRDREGISVVSRRAGLQPVALLKRSRVRTRRGR